MKILVACEKLKTITTELRKLGHRAYSCDIEPYSGEHPEWHIKNYTVSLLNGDCAFYTYDGKLHTVNGPWDMVISFPPHTYLTSAGTRY